MQTHMATVSTDNASRYIRMLCKHFSHKVKVEWDEHSGYAELPSGVARFTAEDNALLIELSAVDDAGFAQGRHIIDSHLLRFAHREPDLTISWE
ncbi:MAG: DUF2218 domain-containing protein [Pseudomonadota bacterium]